MLRQLRRVCRVDAASLVRYQPSPCNSGHRRVFSNFPVIAAAAKDPPWVMLNDCVCRIDDSSVADAKTVAKSGTSIAGEHLHISLAGAAPPASSFLCYDLTTEEDDDDDDTTVDVVAAHADSVLLRLGNKYNGSADFDDNDYFVYRTGAGRPPSLSLITDRDFLTKAETIYASSCSHRPRLYSRKTGLLRRGGANDNDLIVVQVDQWYDRDAQREMLEFCMLRTGDGIQQWELKEPVPILQDGNEGAPRFSGDAVITVGDRFLCWIDYWNGFFVCDMADDTRPKVRYASLPNELSGRCRWDDDDDDTFQMKYSIKMSSAGTGKVKLVSIGPHCCCGHPGRSTCDRSRFAFTLNTWTMDVESTLLTWVKDTEIDCEDIWALPGYEGLPRANLQCPIVSLDDPNIVCFLVSNCYFVTYKERKMWMIQLDMKTKTLRSVVQFSNEPWSAYHHLPAQLQY